MLFAGKLRESKGVHILLRAMTRVWETAAPGGAGAGGRHRIRPYRTMRETPFLTELRRDLARARGRVVLTGFIPPGRHAPGLSPGGRLCGTVPDRGGPRAGLSGSGRGRAPGHRHPHGRHSRRWCGTGKPACCWSRRTTPGNWPGRSSDLLRHQERRRRLGQQGRDWVLGNFSWERIAGTLEEFYDEV